MERKDDLVTLLIVALLAMLVVPSSFAETHVVGDNTGWNTPTSGDPYATWASQHTFAVGDILVFNFATGIHTVANVTRTAFDSCNIGNPLSIQTNGPANFTIGVGSHYFICTMSNHCSLNQKLAVNVVTGNSPSPTFSPTTPSPFSSPRGGASGGVVRTLSPMVMSIGIGLLGFL